MILHPQDPISGILLGPGSYSFVWPTVPKGHGSCLCKVAVGSYGLNRRLKSLLLDSVHFGSLAKNCLRILQIFESVQRCYLWTYDKIFYVVKFYIRAIIAKFCFTDVLCWMPSVIGFASTKYFMQYFVSVLGSWGLSELDQCPSLSSLR